MRTIQPKNAQLTSNKTDDLLLFLGAKIKNIFKNNNKLVNLSIFAQ